MKRVLVLDALQRSALSVTRSLGKRGVFVITADETSSALAGCSRYSQHYSRYPSPRVQPDQFVASIASLAGEHDIQVVLPMTELTTNLLLEKKHELPGITLPFPDQGTVDSLANKGSLMRLAESLGVPTPLTWYVEEPPALPFSLDRLPYPVVLKPNKSWLYSNGEWFRTGVRFADSQAEMEQLLESDPVFQNHPFMVQACVSGNGQGVFALYNKGESVAFFAHRRIREKPPRGGVSVLSESIPIDPTLLSHSRTLLDKAGWHGIAMVEFKVDDDGTPYLMEINTRFWGSLQLAIDAGVDFPWLLYQLACDIDPVQSDNYKQGVRLRWLLGDLDNLYLTVRDKEYRPVEKLKAGLRFLTPAPLCTRHEINRLGDLKPFWWELKQYLKDLSH